jgi:hypothetical protein
MDMPNRIVDAFPSSLSQLHRPNFHYYNNLDAYKSSELFAV